MEVDGERPPHSPPLTPSTRCPSADLADPPHAASTTESRHSEDTEVASDSAFHTPEPGNSALSLPPPSPAMSTRHHDEPGEAGPRDSGIETGRRTTRTSSSSSRPTTSISFMSPNMSALVPPDEDRPDLWRSDHAPPTFRPRVQNTESDSEWMGLQRQEINGPIGAGVYHTRTRPRPRGVRRIFAFFGCGTGDRYRKDLVGLIWNLLFGFMQVRLPHVLC